MAFLLNWRREVLADQQSNDRELAAFISLTGRERQQAMKEEFTASVWQEGDWFVVQCRELEIASQGRTKDEALDNLAEAIEVHFEPPAATILPEVVAVEVEVERGAA